MKKIVLSLAFVLMGTFAFANTKEVKENTITVSKENTIKTVDFATFKSMVDNKEIKIVKIVKLDRMVEFTDSCGNVWNVYYDSSVYSTIGAVITAAEIIEDLTGC